MPSNVVRTPRDEHLWEKAKQVAASQGHAKEYDYIMGIYKKMQGGETTSEPEMAKGDPMSFWEESPITTLMKAVTLPSEKPDRGQDPEDRHRQN